MHREFKSWIAFVLPPSASLASSAAQVALLSYVGPVLLAMSGLKFTSLAILVHFSRRVLPKKETSYPRKSRAQESPGGQCTRSLACEIDQAARVSPRCPPEDPAFPAQWLLRVFASPGCPGLLTRPPSLSQIDAHGPSNHTTWPYASVIFVRLAIARLTLAASTAYRSAFRDVRSPSVGRTGANGTDLGRFRNAKGNI